MLKFLTLTGNSMFSLKQCFCLDDSITVLIVYSANAMVALRHSFCFNSLETTIVTDNLF